MLVIAEPVSAANVAEWEARKRDIRLKSSSFKHFEDSPSLRVRITLSCKTSATHTPVNICTEGEEREKSIKMEDFCPADAPGQATDAQAEDVHEDRMAFLGLFIETSWGPNPVQVGSVRAQVQRGHAAAHRQMMSWHGHNLGHLRGSWVTIRATVTLRVYGTIIHSCQLTGNFSIK